MSQAGMDQQNRIIEELYEDKHEWIVNIGEETIHAKRMSGRFRILKWWSASAWLVFLFGPYLRWNDHQAVIFEIDEREFHFFDLVIFPQDIWLLSFLLLFLAILLAVVTTVLGRIYCGFFCFQTIWTDVFTWVEEILEGPPNVRKKKDKSPLVLNSIWLKGLKHFIWLLIAAFTGLSFVAWFTDAIELWGDYLTLSASLIEWFTLSLFTVGTYVLAGHLREQTCLWLCPYGRIQSVMIDRDTVVPSYDYNRGEPRTKLTRAENNLGGDCIDCNQCLAVCPTGVDIRGGLSEGCISCALCIDACNIVMDKIGKPKGLVRYESMNGLEGINVSRLLKRPRVLVYISIMSVALGVIVNGLLNLEELDIKVLHERKPLYVMLSDGYIQNKYEVKILNKTDKVKHVVLEAEGLNGAKLVGAEEPFLAISGKVMPYTVYLKQAKEDSTDNYNDVYFNFRVVEDQGKIVSYKTMFIRPDIK
jgi:cytochrome c oxidase accessory protein FixG